MPSRHASVATVSVPVTAMGSTLRASVNLSNTMRPPHIPARKRKDRDETVKEKENEVDSHVNGINGSQMAGKPRRAAAVAAESKILESSRKFKKSRKGEHTERLRFQLTGPAPVEEDDGFTFTRVRNIPPPTPPTPASPVPTKRTRPDEIGAQGPMLPQAAKKAVGVDSEAVLPRLRSPSPVPAKPRRLFNLDSSTSYSEDSHTTIVSLPLTDTPMIRRNQQLRQGQGSRRSSLGMRGKRASSLSNGLVAVPHADIPAEDFFKHLDSDLPDPHRMRQLLTWCAHRSKDEPKEKANRRGRSSSPAVAIARVIEEELLKDLTDGKISTSWWNRTDDEDRPKKPNPQNVANLAKIDEFKKRLERLRVERKAWAEAEENFKPRLPPSVNVDVSLLLPNEAAFLARQADRAADETRPSAESLVQRAKDVEFEVDVLRHAMHGIKALTAAAGEYGDQVLRDVAGAAARREQLARQAAGTEGLGMRDVLQTLAKIDRL